MPKNKQLLPILPGQTIGIIGGGQLGRMMALAAKYMGYSIAVLDPTPHCPTAQVADHHIVAAYDDMDGIKELTRLSDVVTYEFENVDVEAAAYIETEGKLPQGTYALEVTQNRQREKELLKHLDLPVPQFYHVNDGNECEKALEKMSFPAVIKTCRGGYDGKGQIKLQSSTDHEKAISFAEEHAPCIVEQWVTFDQEISVIFTRSTDGDISFFPIAENDHVDHILYKTTVPSSASDRVKEKAIHAAKTIADHMEVVGTFAIEMFVKGDDIFINEMAPRPHNSGHYTIEACSVDQFAQHIRAICGLRLAPVQLLQQTQMINVLGEDLDQLLHMMPTLKNGYVHLYGKAEAKEKRKMGHVTFTAQTTDELLTYVQDFEERIRQ